jgi:two-component system cell cycle sensor histidine kinase/response regulator CckA
MSSLGNLPQDFFNRAFRASPVASLVCGSSDFRVLEVNEAFLDLTDLSREQVLGKSILSLTIWADTSAREQAEAYFRDQSPRKQGEWRLSSQSGDARTMLASCSPIVLEDLRCLLISCFDVTERLKQEVNVRQSQKMEAVGQLAAGFAHDFNNILAIIQGYTGLLLGERGMPEFSEKALKEISTATDRAATLTRQLLTFSRKQVMQAKILDLNAVIGGLGTMLQRLLGSDVNLKFQFGAPAPAVRADMGMLEQLIGNLAVNSAEAMPTGGQFVISTSLVEISAAYARLRPEAGAGSFACLTVSDTGCGMDASTLQRIFEPFFTTKGVGKGSGLGLSTVYGIVQQHKGWIEVSSQLGHGTIFQIYLPAEKKPLPNPEETLAAAETNIGGKETILLVEDEPGLRLLVEGILEQFGYNVITAENGVRAIELWGRHKASIHLLLTDMVMPEGVTGRQLALKLKVDRPELKVVYTSGYSIDLMGEGMEELFDGVNYIQKPYRPEVLAQTIRACLSGQKNRGLAAAR